MESVQAEAIVAKSGENCIQVGLRRAAGNDGLLVKVWALPRVEDFIRSLGTGEKLDLGTIGRYWSPAGKDKNTRLFVYELSRPVGTLHVEQAGFSFRIDHPGYPLVETVPDGSVGPDGEVYAAPGGGLRQRMVGGTQDVLNMGFLRLVGISSENGVSFVVPGVTTRDAIDNLAVRIEQAARKFYLEFLKPYHVIITVSTMPIPDHF